MLRVVLTYKARVVWALGVKEGAVSKCVTREASGRAVGQHRGCPLRGCHTSSDGCSRKKKKGRGSIEYFFNFLSKIGAQRGLRGGRQGYEALANPAWRVLITR